MLRSAFRYLVPVLALALSLPACGTTRNTDVRDPDVIGLEEITRLEYMSALEVIHRLRPAWLSRRTLPGPVATQAGNDLRPDVFIDGMPQDDFHILDRVSAREIQEIRYLDGLAATTRFGTGHANGAILISTHNGA